MVTIRNKSDHSVTVIIKGEPYILPSCHRMEVPSLSAIQNLSEIRSAIVVGQDLSEIAGHA